MPTRPTADDAPRLKRERRAARRRAQLALRLAAAHSPSARIAAASDYLRGVVKHVPGELSDRVAGEVVAYLAHHADQLLDQGRRTDDRK